MSDNEDEKGCLYLILVMFFAMFVFGGISYLESQSDSYVVEATYLDGGTITKTFDAKPSLEGTNLGTFLSPAILTNISRYKIIKVIPKPIQNKKE